MERNQVEVATATVSLRTLMIGERQVTAGIIRQVPYEWWDADSDPAPWVRFGCGVDRRCAQRGLHHHFLWVNEDGELRKATIEFLTPREAAAEMRGDGMAESDPDWADTLRARVTYARDKYEAVASLPYIYAAGMR